MGENKKNDIINIAVVGTGIIGLDHIEAIMRTDNFRLCALCDVNEEKVKDLSGKYGVPYFLDYKEIPSKSEADAVILNLPHGLHCESTVFFLNSGLHVLVEKPMANSSSECQLMLDVAKRNNKKLAVGHVQRFYLANQCVIENVMSGELGKLCMFSERRSINYFLPERPKWFFSKKLAGGGIVMNYGAHALDKLFSVLGGVQDVAVHSAVGKPDKSSEIEGYAQILLSFKNGPSAAITFNGYDQTGYDTLYYFSNGVLKVKNNKVLCCKGGIWQTILSGEDGNHIVRELDEFYKYIIGEPSDIPTGEYGQAVISVIEQIYMNN